MVKALLAALIAATLVNSPLAAQEYLEGEIIICLHRELPNPVSRLSSGQFVSGASSLDSVLAQHSAQVFERFSGFTEYGRRLYRLKVPSTVNIESVLQDLKNDPNVEEAERIELLSTGLTPNDTDWSQQWNFDANHLQTEDAWDIETGSDNVILAVIDTGLDHHHPDLMQNIWRGTDTPIGLDFCGNVVGTCNYSAGTRDTDPQHEGGETYSHGTKMVGVAAAKINNMSNVAGLAGGTTNSDGVRIMGLRAGYEDATGSSGSVRPGRAIDAIDFLVAHQRRNPNLSYVVNMSFVGLGRRTTFQTAVTNAWNTGRIVLVGIANLSNNNVVGYPAGYDHVIGVTGVLRNDRKGTNAGYGAYVDVAAPVDNVPTVAYDANPTRPSLRTPPQTDPLGWPHISWSSRGSTPSISGAQVSGLAALVWSKYPELTNEGVVHQILSTVDNIRDANRNADGTATPWSGQIGGRINAYRALTEWSGPLLVQAGETLTWSGSITVTDDVTIPDNTTLVLDANTTVEFAANTELIVADGGTLTATANNITFRSVNDNPTGPEWDGIRVRAGGTATLSDVTIQDGFRCVQEEEVGDQATLTMTNVTLSNCGATVTLDRTLPYAEQQITATLTPVARDEEWQWQRRRSTDAWTDIASAETATYTPDARDEATEDEGDEGWQLRATVRYQAEANVYPHAQSAATTPVVGVPSAPENLTVVKVGDGTVTLRWDNPDNATIDNWQYRQNGGDNWQSMSGANAYVYDHLTNTYEYTVRGLTNETTYTFEVQAHNAAGWGAASESVTATPRLFTLTATALNGSVLLDWTPAPSRGASIDRYAYRYSSDAGDTWTDTSSAWVRDLHADDPLSYTVQELTNDELHTFEMYAYDSAGEVAVALASAIPRTETAAVQVAYGSDSYQAQEGGEAVEVTVRLTGPAHKAVSIPVTVTRDTGTEVGDYAVGWKEHPAHSLSFAKGDRSQSFEITANQDADSDDETVTVGLTLDGDDLPSWLGAGTPPTATVRLLDDDGNRTVSFSSVLYQATEGGAAVEVSVRLSPAPWQTVSIPVQVTGTEAGAYTVPNLAADGTVTLSFAAGVSSRSFTLTANEDADNADETVSLTFGTLPAGVVAVGTTQQATVRLLDNDGVVSLSSQSPQEDTQLTAELTDRSGGITNTTWQWQRRSNPTDSWTPVAGTSISTYTPQSGDVGDQLRATVEYDDADGTDQSAASAPTAAVQALPETEYAYRASQTAPLPFDAVASGTPDNWSSSEITWTDAAPRVWRIERTRPSGGTWSEWGGLEKYSERPVAQPDPFYRQAASQPDPPGNMISSATPTDWQTSNPGATATKGVWRTERTRPAGATHYRFSTPTQITPPLETETAYRLHTSGTTAPTFTASASSVPTGWSSSRQPPTSASAPYEWEIRRTRPAGESWSSWGSATVVSKYTERQSAYRVGNSGSTAPSFSASSSGIPTGWSSSRRTPGPSVPYEWEISRTRPAGESWSSWGSATVVSKYTERQSAYRVGNSGSTAPSFSASSSGIPTGWSSSRRTPGPSVPYEWEISRTRPAGESWSSWGSATVVSKYTERQSAYRRNNFGSTPPSFSASASGVPTGWSSSRQTPTSSNRYEWKISRTRPAGESWSSWGSATVVSKYTERQSAYRVGNSGSTAPSFSASSSGIPTGWSSSRRTPGPSVPYEWEISRTRPAGGSWSSWGSATVVSKYTERQYAYRVGNSGSTAPSFSASSSGIPTGWSSSRRTPGPSVPYEWEISRTRPAGESWSSWGSATVVSKYTERQSAYRRNNSGSGPPSFSASASGVPSGWSSSRQTPTSSHRYEWKISRTRPAGESWSSWGSATVVSKYTERQTAYKRNDSGTTAPSFSSTASGVPYGWSSSQPSATSSHRYVWQISRTRPAGGSWSSWGSATVVSKYTERQTAYKRNDSGTTAPSFSSTASGVPYGWSSSQPSATSSHRYVWQISRTRPAGGAWSSWGSATVVSKYTERQTAYKRNDSGTTAPSFSSTASGVPYGWSSSQPSATSSHRYVWQISRTRPAGGSWSSWGSATVVSRYGSSAYRLDNSYLQPLAFTTASGLPTGWGSARQMPTLSKPRLGGRVAVQPG